MKKLKYFQNKSGLVFNILLTMVFIGLFGRWVFVPSIKKIYMNKSENHTDDFQVGFEQVQTDCIKKRSCLISDLLNPYFLHKENVVTTREYILDNFTTLRNENEYLSYLLLAHFVNTTSFDFISGENLAHLTKPQQAGFFEGLFHCVGSECKDYFKLNETHIKKYSTRIQFLKIRLKQEESWTKLNKELDELLNLIIENQSYIQLISLIEYIPNHPKLRSSLEKYYLNIFGQKNIEKASFHLSRYNPGWHDRKFSEVLSSRSNPHIDNFLLTMIVGCPQKTMQMIRTNFSNLSDISKEIFKSQAKLFLSRKDEAYKFFNFPESDKEMELESKCITGSSKF